MTARRFDLSAQRRALLERMLAEEGLAAPAVAPIERYDEALRAAPTTPVGV